ncbi:NADH dehydrogenase (Quinone) [Magnetospira sp. QH-2]|nr:NADH dehydrogenase (Quinone) [Magnetospira sp. QH-2]
MTDVTFPPGLVLALGAFLLPLMPKGWMRTSYMLALPLLAMAMVWGVADGPGAAYPFLEYEIVPVQADALSRLFGTIFTLMAFAGALYALNQDKIHELTAAYAYAGSAVGVALAGDLITVFVFWEIMAVASTVVIWSAGTDSAYKASMRYVMVHLLGGVVLMVGIVAHVMEVGSIAFTAMEANSFATAMILIGFIINAGAPPLSAWLPDAYPEASWSGTVFLSAFTTKTAVYVLIRGFPGEEILVYVGLYMIFYGIIYALLENDMRRILAYSIVNQVGFMITGIGIGTEMALNGAAAHAFAHIIYKALLLMSAGSVLYMTRDEEFPDGRRKCTDLGGLFQSMPLTMVCGTIGALAISSFPWTSGFISKSMISQGAANEHMMFAWLLLTAASAGVFLHAGIKFPWFVFFQKDRGIRPPDPPWNMRAAMVFFAFLCIFLGVMPGPLYAILPFPVNYEPYTGAHVVNMLELLLFSGFAFFVLLPLMKRTLTLTLDFDWFYRTFGMALFRVAKAFAVRITDAYWKAIKTVSAAGSMFGEGLTAEYAVLGRTWSSGTMGLVVMVLLAVFLVVYLL